MSHPIKLSQPTFCVIACLFVEQYKTTLHKTLPLNDARQLSGNILVDEGTVHPIQISLKKMLLYSESPKSLRGGSESVNTIRSLFDGIKSAYILHATTKTIENFSVPLFQ